jgi:hypothetical protein
MESIVGNHAPLSSLFAMNTRIFQISLDTFIILPLLVENANNSSLYFLIKIEMKEWRSEDKVSPLWSG